MPQVSRDAVQSVLPVVRHILAGVEHVKSSHPEKDCGRKHDDARIQSAADRDPCSCGCNSQRQAEHQVRPAGEPLGVGVKQEHREDHRRKQECLPVQLRRSQNKDQRHEHSKAGDEAAAQQTGRNRARRSSRIGGVQAGIGPAIERHGSGSRGDHANHNPENFGPGRPTGAASIAPERAKGRAKIECSHLIISSVVPTLRNNAMRLSVLGAPVVVGGNRGCKRKWPAR